MGSELGLRSEAVSAGGFYVDNLHWENYRDGNEPPILHCSLNKMTWEKETKKPENPDFRKAEEEKIRKKTNSQFWEKEYEKLKPASSQKQRNRNGYVIPARRTCQVIPWTENQATDPKLPADDENPKFLLTRRPLSLLLKTNIPT